MDQKEGKKLKSEKHVDVNKLQKDLKKELWQTHDVHLASVMFYATLVHVFLMSGNYLSFAV